MAQAILAQGNRLERFFLVWAPRRDLSAIATILTMVTLLPIPLVRDPAGAPDDLGPDSSILDLVKYNMLEEIKKRFQQPPFAGNINAKIDSCGNPLLHCAAGFGNFSIMMWALKEGADINLLNERGWSPAAEAEYWAGRWSTMNKATNSMYCTMARRWLLDMGGKVLGNADTAVYRRLRGLEPPKKRLRRTFPTEQETAKDPPPVYLEAQRLWNEAIVDDAMTGGMLSLSDLNPTDFFMPEDESVPKSTSAPM